MNVMLVFAAIFAVLTALSLWWIDDTFTAIVAATAMVFSIAVAIAERKARRPAGKDRGTGGTV